MASSSSLFSKDNFLCPICLSVFTQPVSTPCGHNFCMSCISTYWNDTQPCWCPVCKEYFERRPYLKVNTFISELVPQLMRLQVASAPNQSAQQQQVSSDNEVLCNICTDTQKQAVKSCLECLTSYCDVHLEPHHRAAGLKRHTLVEPTADVEDHICKEHNKLLVLFCRDDSMLLCDFCVSSGHTLHSVAPVKQAHEEMKDLLEKTQDKVQRMVEERMQKVDDLMGSLEETKTKSADLIGSSPLGLTEVVSEIQKELLRAVMETQTKAEEEADVFIRSMQQEIVELKMANMKLRDLKEIKNAISFLQSYPRPFTLPHTMDLSTFRMNRHLDIKHVHQVVRKSVSQLRELLNKLNTEICKLSDGADVTKEIELRYAQQYEVNIVLDPDTAHPMLVLSDDRKQVRYGVHVDERTDAIPNPNKFTHYLAVLGKRGFMSEKFYFEVYVGKKTEWCLGVAKASLQRGEMLNRSSHSELWAIWFRENKFETFNNPFVAVHMGLVERVGVFVDYDEGQISFYDVEAKTIIYTFEDCHFTEELYPYFNPCDDEYDSNLDPMVIIPVHHM